MNSYVIQINGAGRSFFAEGLSVEPGWHVMFTNEVGALTDISGPWDCEEDAEMARIRAEQMYG